MTAIRQSMTRAPPTLAAGGLHLAGLYPFLLPLVLAVSLICALLYFDTEQLIRGLFAWLDALGVWAPVVFVLFDMLVVVFLLPGIVLTMGAGDIGAYAAGLRERLSTKPSLTVHS